MAPAKSAPRTGHETLIDHAPLPTEQDQKNVTRPAGKQALHKKTEPRTSKPAPPVRQETNSQPQSQTLSCRYCGSADLAPSFIKRRDRRCRACFSQRYRAAAAARNAKVKK
jgi:hypothetical protein